MNEEVGLIFGKTYAEIAQLIKRADDLDASELLRENVILAGKVSRYEHLLNKLLEVRDMGKQISDGYGGIR